MARTINDDGVYPRPTPIVKAPFVSLTTTTHLMSPAVAAFIGGQTEPVAAAARPQLVLF